MEPTNEKFTPEILKIAVSNEHNVPVEDVEIDDIRIKDGSKKGDGFICQIAAITFQASFNGQRIEKNYIAKFAEDGHRKEMVKQMKVFEQEGKTYTWLIPQLQKMREEKGLKRLAFAKCFYASAEDTLIILENLKVVNFEVVAKKPEPLTLNAVKLVLQEMAAFHATGDHFITTYPGGLEALAHECPRIFTEDFFNAKGEGEEISHQFSTMIAKMFHSCVIVAKRFGSKELGHKMEEYQKTVKEKIIRIIEDQGHGKMLFVTHGDAWYNNFLYRYSNLDSKDPTDLIMVDLQNTRIGRPGIDLSYFFCSSTSPQQRKDHFEELLRFYYDCFFEELRNLGNTSEPYFTFEDLKQEYSECYNYGFIMGCMHSQILLVNEDGEATLSIDSLGDEEASARMAETMEVELLAKAEASPEYRRLVIGLAEEALERKII